MDDILIAGDSTLAEVSIKENTSEAEVETEKEKKFCLNCGTEVADNFCPHCGQSTATPSKLKMKNFGKGLIMSFGRLTPGFFNTAKGLLFRPWTVIQDHIHGRHIPYSPPITMLIQIALYSTIIFAVLDSILGTEIVMDYSLFEYEGDNAFIKMIDSSVVISTLFIGIPMCFCVYIAYYRHGARKYNFAEYLVAYTYLFCSITLWDSIFNLFNIIPGLDFDMTSLTLGIVIFFSIIILLKAFPQNKKWKYAALLLWCTLILSLGVILIAFIVYLPSLIKRIELFN